jgi:hypothetical protein
MTDQSFDERDVLRAVWAAEGQRADFDEECSPTKTCRNMKDVSFDGLAEPGSDLRSAWRDKLAREGKLSTSGGTLADLIFGPAGDHTE